MFEARSDVICCSSGCRGEEAWQETVRLAPKRPALSRVTDRIRRPQFDQVPRAARFPGYGPSGTERAQRIPLGVSAAIVAKRDQWLRADAVGDLSPSSDGLRRSCRRRIQRGLDVDALFRSGRDCGPDAVEVVGVCAVRTDASRKAGSRRKSIPGRRKRCGSNERTGGVARRRTIQAKTNGCADCPAVRVRMVRRPVDVYRTPALSANIDEAAGPDCEPALAEQLGHFVRAARSAFSSNTERAVRSDLGIYTNWCAQRGKRALPANAETIADFVDAMAEIRAPATVRRYVSSIATAHRGEIPDRRQPDATWLALGR